MKDNKNFLCKNIVELTHFFLETTFKNGIPYKNRQRKHNKPSSRPFAAINLKVTNRFNIETHHM